MASSDEGFMLLRSNVIAAADNYLAIQLPPPGQWSGSVPNGAATLATAWRIDHDERYLEGLRRYLEQASSLKDLRGGPADTYDLDQGVALLDLSLAYSWVHAELAPPLRDKLRALLLAEADQAFSIFSRRTRSYFWNHAHQQGVGIYAVACAFPDDPRSALWCAEVEGFFERMQTLLDQAGDASYLEGSAYASIVYTNLAQYTELYRGRHGATSNHIWWRSLVDYTGGMRRPDGAGTLRYADDRGRWFWPPSAPLRFVASTYGDSRAQGLADELDALKQSREAYSKTLAWQSLLLADPRVKSAPYSVPRTQHFKDAGYYIARSGSGETAALLAARSGLPGGAVFNEELRLRSDNSFANLGHLHADLNSFSWWAGASCLLSDPGHERTKLSGQHNTLTFDGIGQLGSGGPWWGENGKQRPWGYGGEILDTQRSAGMTVVTMEADDVYPAAVGLSKFRRRLIWLEPDVLVVMDRIQLTAVRRIEANWIGELGAWSGSTLGARSGGRLQVAALGDTQLGWKFEELEIEAGRRVHRAQSFCNALPGETRLIHVFWDSAQGGLQSEALSNSAVTLRSNGREVSVTAEPDGLRISGALSGYFDWNSL